MDLRNEIQKLKEQISQNIIGQDELVERMLIVLLADGNMLLEGLPGLAKTRAIKSLAQNLDANLSRIQFTPDLLPSDITGTEIYQPESSEKFVFQSGPLFSNLILADEINRAPAKVQSALLEAMEERQVTVAGKSYKMEPLFMVMATQNPVEQEGTYPLPEAQMDRFLMKILIDYPNEASEIEILKLVRNEAKAKQISVEPISKETIFEARKKILDVEVSEAAEKYIVDLVFATRYPERYSETLKNWIDVGVSPRGSIALDKCSRVIAWLDGRDFVNPDDIRKVVFEVFRHRIMLSYSANAEGIKPDRVINEILKVVPVV